MYMDEDRPMSGQEPEDQLERLFAQEETAIRDDGFTARVMDNARGGGRWRTPAIYGAGLAGAGFAVGGIAEMAPHLKIGEWLSGVTASVTTAVQNADLAHAAQNVPDATQLAIVAVVAGISFLVAAVSAQSR
jgi:hypothetical protein